MSFFLGSLSSQKKKKEPDKPESWNLNAALGTLTTEPARDILEGLVDEGLASRYHWCHWLNNFPVGGKKETLTLRTAVVWLSTQSRQWEARTTAGALGLPVF